VAVERLAGRVDGEGEEGVLWHLEADVEVAGRVRQAPRRGVDPRRRPPEEEARAEEEGVLEVVDQAIFEGGIVERREVGPPGDAGEDEPGDDGVGDDPDDPTVEDREDPAATVLRARHAQEEGHRSGQGEEGRGNHRQEEVLDHVDRKEARVVVLDPRLEGDGDGDEPAAEGPRPVSGHRVGGMGGVHPSNRPAPGEASRHERDPDPGIEGPGEGEVDRRRWLGRHGPVGEGRRGGTEGPGGSEERPEPDGDGVPDGSGGDGARLRRHDRSILADGRRRGRERRPRADLLRRRRWSTRTAGFRSGAPVGIDGAPRRRSASAPGTRRTRPLGPLLRRRSRGGGRPSPPGWPRRRVSRSAAIIDARAPACVRPGAVVFWGGSPPQPPPQTP